MSGLLNLCFCMPIQLPMLVWGMAVPVDILGFLDTHFICNLCWGGIIGHIKFSMFSTTRLLGTLLTWPIFLDLWVMMEQYNRSDLLLSNCVIFSVIFSSKFEIRGQQNSMTCKNLTLFNLKTTLFWSWVSVPWSRLRATLYPGAPPGQKFSYRLNTVIELVCKMWANSYK